MTTPANPPPRCTAATRPAHPPAGTRVYEEDTGRIMEYQANGSWREAERDDAYGVHMGTVASVCQRCGALVYPDDTARRLHTEFHAGFDRQAEYEAEQRERSE